MMWVILPCIVMLINDDDPSGSSDWESYVVYPSGIFDPDVEYVAILSNT